MTAFQAARAYIENHQASVKLSAGLGFALVVMQVYSSLSDSPQISNPLLQGLLVEISPPPPPVVWDRLAGTPVGQPHSNVIVSEASPRAAIVSAFLSRNEVEAFLHTARQQYNSSGFVWKVTIHLRRFPILQTTAVL